MSSLKDKTIKGMSWSLLENVAGSGMTFLVGLVLARILTPDEFGIIGLLTVFLAIALIFVDSGFSQSLIRKQEILNQDYDTLFLFNLAVSVVCYTLLFFGAPWIAEYFSQPALCAIVQVTGLVLIINAVAIVQKVIFTRALDFKIQAKITICGAIISGIIGITMAFMGFGIWSLVGQMISKQLTTTILSWAWSDWRPRLHIDIDSFKEMFHFGYKLLISGLIDTLYKNIFYVIIGKFHTVRSLGEYTRAEQFASIFSANLTGVIQKVSYPVLSSMQDDPQRLKQGYRRIIKTSTIICFALMLGLAAVAKPLIVILIGEKWLPSVYLLQILCFSEMLYPLHAINLNILNVRGRSDLFLRLEIIKKIIAIPMLLVGIYYNIPAMLWCSVLMSYTAYFINAHYSAGLIDYPVSEQVKDILPSLLVSLLVAGVMWSITLLDFNNYLTLFIQLITGIFLAIVIYEKLNSEEYIELKSLSLSTIRKIRNGRK